MTREPTSDRRPDPRAEAPGLRAERAEALGLALLGGLSGLDFSPERWLDRLEAGR